MVVKLTITYRGPGTAPGLRLKDEHGTFHRLELDDLGMVSIEVSPGVHLFLFWAVVGSIGAGYSITMSAPKGWEVEAARNPITRKVPAAEFGWGRERLKLTPIAGGGSR